MFVLLCFIEVGLGPLKRKVDMFVLLCCIEVGLGPLERKIDATRLERIDARMARWMCNVRPEGKISADELRTRLKFREFSQDRRLQ